MKKLSFSLGIAAVGQTDGATSVVRSSLNKAK